MSGSGSCHCVRSILSNSAGQSSFGIQKILNCPSCKRLHGCQKIHLYVAYATSLGNELPSFVFQGARHPMIIIVEMAILGGPRCQTDPKYHSVGVI